MRRGRKSNIPTQKKEEIKNSVVKNPDIRFIDEVFEQTKEFNNTKQTFELLSEIASLDCIKELNFKGLEDVDFSNNAKNIAKKAGCEEEYNDPDKYSLILYMAYGKFLSKKNVLTNYTIINNNYCFAIKGVYEHNNRNESVILGTDGISIKMIKEYHYNQNCYKKLGGFFVWPRHPKPTINTNRGFKLKDRWDYTMQDIEQFYNNKSSSSLITNKEDIAWMNYLGKIKEDRQDYDSFKALFELDEVEYDLHGIITKECIEKRNEKIWKIINK